jgi:hypothetical protein
MLKVSKSNYTKKEPRMNSLVELYCDVDDFCQAFLPSWENQQLASGLKQRRRRGQLCLSEIMTIIACHSNC